MSLLPRLKINQKQDQVKHKDKFLHSSFRKKGFIKVQKQKHTKHDREVKRAFEIFTKLISKTLVKLSAKTNSVNRLSLFETKFGNISETIRSSATGNVRK